MSRRWRGNALGDGPITFESGAFVGYNIGNFTSAIIWKPDSVHAGGLYRAFSPVGDTPHAVNEYSDGEIYYSLGGFDSPASYMATDGWRLDSFTKVGGFTGDVDWHTYFYNTDTWNHIDNGTRNDSPYNMGGDIYVGAFQASEVLVGEIAVLGMWKSVLPNLALEGLTTDLLSWVDLNPDILWAFNQDDVTDPVVDLSGGGADQVARVGTVVGVSDPPGFDYSLETSTRFFRESGVWVPVTRHVRQGGAWVPL